MHVVFFVCALTSIAAVVLICLFLFANGIPAMKEIGLLNFLTGAKWKPGNDIYGILPMILGSIYITAGAVVIGVPIGLLTAIFMAFYCPKKLYGLLKPCTELLVGIPSIVYGFFGMVIVAPFLQDWFGADTGLNLLNAALMLAFMSVPTICSVAEDALFAVPRTLREASLALGATRWETLIRVVIPSALSGIGTAVMLGMSRAIGETMVVLMVAGGAAIIPLSIFDPVRPMPASIAAEMAEAPFRGDHYFALFATGIVLFLFTLLFNMLAFRIAEKHKQTGSSGL